MKKKLTTILATLLAVLLVVFFRGPETEPAAAPTTAPSLTEVTVWAEAADTGPAPTETVILPEEEETVPAPTETVALAEEEGAAPIAADGVYTSKEDVALYIHTYGYLPENFITKKEARELGWEGGGLEDIAPGKCIGGDRFGNYEGLLPDADGRRYTECDIDTLGKSSRGAKRVVFSNDGLIYYTEDHYESFELLYGEP